VPPCQCPCCLPPPGALGYLRLIDSCITQLKAQGPSRTCNEGKEEGVHAPFPRLCSGSEAGSYLRLIDSCINQLKAQGPSRTCNESKEDGVHAPFPRQQGWGLGFGVVFKAHRLLYHPTLGLRVIKKRREEFGVAGSGLRVSRPLRPSTGVPRL